MNFENQIKLLAQNIYDRVTSIVKENKRDDDKYYKYAYLKLKDKTQLTYDFSTETLYVAKADTPEIPINFIVKINNMDTIYYTYDDDEYMCYETLLEEKCNNAKHKQVYNARILRQEKLTKEQQEEIKKYYEELIKKIDNLTYDENKTRCIENFVDELDDIYRKYMYEKEFWNANRSEDKILPSVKTAVEWWADKISGEERSYPQDPFEIMMVELSETTYPTEKIEKEKLERFKEALAEKLMEEIYVYGGDIVEMRCDYSADRLLLDAMIVADIEPSRAPYKTELCVDAYHVVVRESQDTDDRTIFDSTQREDIEEVKRIYNQLLASRKSLKRER